MTRFELRMTEEEKAAWREAALRAGKTVSEWVRDVLGEAAGLQMIEPLEARPEAREVRVEVEEIAAEAAVAGPPITPDDPPADVVPVFEPSRVAPWRLLLEGDRIERGKK